MASQEDTTDLQWGWYRKHYGAYIRGKRINQISLTAEAWFWRVHDAAADDFGNTERDASLVFAATVGRRKNVTVENVEAWLLEMEKVDLIRLYEVKGETFLHVVDFLRRQSAGKNGRRVKRCPTSPWDDDELNCEIPVNPGESSARDYQRDYQNQIKPASTGSAEPAIAASAATTASIVIFQTVKGKKSAEQQWALTEKFVEELRAGFPSVDVVAEAKKAKLWMDGNESKRKTASGMKDFLFRWMERAQNRGGSSPLPSENGHGKSRKDLEIENMVARAAAQVNP
jgi:hypothetical protein